MTQDLVASALEGLAGERLSRAEAEVHVPPQPGLYAFFGDADAWRALGLGSRSSEQPLYVGKAERSLNGRDVGTHFSTGKTGSSTVRRSLAALLVQQLELVAIPRNLARPDGSANFALDPSSDNRLSQWMEMHLSLAHWVWPGGDDLGQLETTVVRHLRPPLNIDKVGEPRTRLKSARAHLASIARSHSAGTISTELDQP